MGGQLELQALAETLFYARFPQNSPLIVVTDSAPSEDSAIVSLINHLLTERGQVGTGPRGASQGNSRPQLCNDSREHKSSLLGHSMIVDSLLPS